MYVIVHQTKPYPKSQFGEQICEKSYEGALTCNETNSKIQKEEDIEILFKDDS